MYTVNEVATTDYSAKLKSSLWGQMIYSISSGLFGTLLVVLFLTGFMPLTATVRYIPWIIGFNTALAGYTLTDRVRGRIRYQRAAGTVAGILVAAATCISLNLLTGYMVGIGLIYWSDMLFFVIIGMGFGGLGAALSIKHTAIKKNKQIQHQEKT